MIMEAVALKADKEDQKAEKAQAQKEWKRDKSGLDNLREAAAQSIN